MRNLFANHQPPLAAVRQGERAGIAVGTAQLFQGGSGTAQLSIRIRAFHCNEHPANPHKRQAVFAQHRQGGYRTGAGDIKLFTPDFAGGFLCALLGELYPRQAKFPAQVVIPDTADMWGTIRTVDPEQKVSALIHQRMTEIAQGVATAYRCTAEVEFSDYCPCMVVDTPLAGNALTYMTELLGKGAMDMTPLTGGKPGGGSEDFAFVSHEVPTVSMFLAAGNAKEGYTYGQHHPKVRFDDSILYRGTAAYTYMALRWLAEHQ